MYLNKLWWVPVLLVSAFLATSCEEDEVDNSLLEGNVDSLSNNLDDYDNRLDSLIAVIDSLNNVDDSGQRIDSLITVIDSLRLIDGRFDSLASVVDSYDGLDDEIDLNVDQIDSLIHVIDSLTDVYNQEYNPDPLVLTLTGNMNDDDSTAFEVSRELRRLISDRTKTVSIYEVSESIYQVVIQLVGADFGIGIGDNIGEYLGVMLSIDINQSGKDAILEMEFETGINVLNEAERTHFWYENDFDYTKPVQDEPIDEEPILTPLAQIIAIEPADFDVEVLDLDVDNQTIEFDLTFMDTEFSNSNSFDNASTLHISFEGSLEWASEISSLRN